MDALEKSCSGERSWDLKAGDAILFWGEVYHWTHHTPNARLALSIRYLPSDFVYTGHKTSWDGREGMPAPCALLAGSRPFPVLYPPENETRDPVWPLFLEGGPFYEPRSLIRAIREIMQPLPAP